MLKPSLAIPELTNPTLTLNSTAWNCLRGTPGLGWKQPLWVIPIVPCRTGTLLYTYLMHTAYISSILSVNIAYIFIHLRCIFPYIHIVNCLTRYDNKYILFFTIFRDLPTFSAELHLWCKDVDVLSLWRNNWSHYLEAFSVTIFLQSDDCIINMLAFHWWIPPHESFTVISANQELVAVFSIKSGKSYN